MWERNELVLETQVGHDDPTTSSFERSRSSTGLVGANGDKRMLECRGRLMWAGCTKKFGCSDSERSVHVCLYVSQLQLDDWVSPRSRSTRPAWPWDPIRAQGRAGTVPALTPGATEVDWRVPFMAAT